MKQRYSTEHDEGLNKTLLMLKIKLGYRTKADVIRRLIRHFCASKNINLKEVM